MIDIFASQQSYKKFEIINAFLSKSNINLSGELIIVNNKGTRQKLMTKHVDSTVPKRGNDHRTA